MNSWQSGKPVEILLVEDNAGDIRLLQETMLDARVHNHLSVVRDGVEAMDFLRRRPPFSSAPRPDLVLLDLNLPRRSGPEVLADMRSDPDLRELPVAVLTSSQAEEDVARAYMLKANCYLIKPLNAGQLLNVVRTIGGFWLTIVKRDDR